MEQSTEMIESLIERATEYGKTSFELAKLKALDKTSEVVSSMIPHSVIVAFLAFFLFFLSLGVVLWLGEVLGKIYDGFFVVAAFYGVVGFVIHFVLNKWLKRCVRNHFIRTVLN